MADFPAADQPAAELCAERVRECQVYVGILGTRYGSPVRDRPDVSYTELEFDTATEAGLDRLVFLLDESAADVGIPLSALIDRKFGARQDTFRHRVQESGLVTSSFASPAALGQLVERSLRELATAWHPSSGSLNRLLIRVTRVTRSGESEEIEIFDAESADQWIRNNSWSQPQPPGAEAVVGNPEAVRFGLDGRTVAIGLFAVVLALVLGAVAGTQAGAAAGALAALAGLMPPAVLAVAVERRQRNIVRMKKRQEVLRRFAPPKPTRNGEDE